MIASLLLAAAASAGATTSPAAAASYSALAEAAGYCELKVAAGDFRFTLPREAVMYQATAPNVAAVLRQRGVNLGPTNADLPDLVKRFAATQPMRHIPGIGPDMFEYIRFGRNGSYAWTVAHPSAPACDVLVTDTAKPLAERDALAVKMQGGGWTLDRDQANAALWAKTFSKSGSDGKSRINARMQGLGADADKSGVQMEIQFARLTQK